MARRHFACIALALLIAGGASAQSLYRYLDPSGRVVYSDQPPPPSAREVQERKLPENVIETDPTPLAARQAAERFPVTFYTFDCDICREAQALLVKRGIPFETVVVTEEKGAARLKALTGKQSGPVLQVGEKQVLQGYNAERWQAVLDEAGYPRAAPPQRAQTARASQPPGGTAKAATATAAMPKDEHPAAGEGYPK